MVSLLLLLIFSLFALTVSFTSPLASSCTKYKNKLPASLLVLATSNNHHHHNHDNKNNVNSNNQSSRRDILHKSSLTFGSLLTLTTTPTTQSAALAMGGGKSRTAGYKIQHTEKEWSDMLSPTQYFILRNGGTEAPYSSILEAEDRNGLFVCAGCNTPLFNSNEKFHSGTGWPSFAKPIMNNDEESSGKISNVEMENVSKIQYQLAGAEVRCQSCGGHLGDVFADGYLFPGTPAFVTGKRYCIDGAALLFIPKDQSSSSNESGLEVVRGDMPPKNGGRGVFPG